METHFFRVDRKSRAFLASASSVYVHRNVFLEFVGVLKPVVSSGAVRHEPGDGFGFVCGVILLWRRSLLPLWIVVNPAFVRSDNVAVTPVRRRPVDHVVKLDMLRMVRTFEEIKYPNLPQETDFSPGGTTEAIF